MCHKQIIQYFLLMENMRIKLWDICPSLGVKLPRNTGFQSLINLVYMKCLPGSWKEVMFGNISTCMILQNHCCRPEFWMHSNLGLFSNRRKQIDIPKFLSSLPWLHGPCHLPVPLRLSFHWLHHHLACQPCVYSVLCTAATQDFLDPVQMKDQTLMFLTYCNLNSFKIILKQSNTWIRVNSICPSWEELDLYNE